VIAGDGGVNGDTLIYGDDTECMDVSADGEND
jgi:hypothetical protein